MGVFVVADSVVSCFVTGSALPLSDICVRRYARAVFQRSAVIIEPHVESISDWTSTDSGLGLNAISRADAAALAACAISRKGVSYVVVSVTSTTKNVEVSGRGPAGRRGTHCIDAFRAELFFRIAGFCGAGTVR